MDVDAAVRDLWSVRHMSDGLAWAMKHAPEGVGEGGPQAAADRAWRECRDVEAMARLAGARGIGFAEVNVDTTGRHAARLLGGGHAFARPDRILTLKTYGGARIELRLAESAYASPSLVREQNAALVRAVVPECPVRFDALPGAARATGDDYRAR